MIYAFPKSIFYQSVPLELGKTVLKCFQFVSFISSMETLFKEKSHDMNYTPARDHYKTPGIPLNRYKQNRSIACDLPES